MFRGNEWYTKTVRKFLVRKFLPQISVRKSVRKSSVRKFFTQVSYPLVFCPQVLPQISVCKFSVHKFLPQIFCPKIMSASSVRKFFYACFLSANFLLKSIERLARFFRGFASITKKISIFPVPDLPKISFSSPSFCRHTSIQMFLSKQTTQIA
ncbi:unnamed protein product [Meloidogyne enterolobii]|uniref:Uncharacterized protein n=1 Tax=Meloidogyne enterolobii TaxID=390850 RepID=A0ACB0ZQB6_MELEN